MRLLIVLIKNTFLILITIFYSLSFLSTIYADSPTIDRKAAIIIDDFGGVGKGTEEFLASDIPVTVAIMPFLEHSSEIAEKANEQGFEVIIHLPMEPKKGKRSWLGPKAITSDLSLQEVEKRVEDAIENVPHAKGINQHMGSKIVENKEMITTILTVAKSHGLYVVDSGTNPRSYISSVSEELGIPSAKRDLFLDNTLSSQGHVYEMATQLADLTIKGRDAIGIGHVGIHGIETFQAIEEAQPYFLENNVDIVPASELMKFDIDKNPEYFWLQ